jgi:hypothetical protein
MPQLIRSFPLAFFFLVSVLAGASPPADRSESFKGLQSRVGRRLVEWRPTVDEKRFDQVGWCTTLLEAENLARQHRRPIFLFTHDGRMNVGRC